MHEKSNKILSPKTIEKLRRSEASPNIIVERSTLYERRYNHKIAKTNSVDNVGYTSNDCDSHNNSALKEQANVKITNGWNIESISMNSERNSKAKYYKPTLENHKKIGFLSANLVKKSNESAMRKSMGNMSYSIKGKVKKTEIEDELPQMSKLFDSNGKSKNHSRMQYNLETSDTKSVVEPIRSSSIK